MAAVLARRRVATLPNQTETEMKMIMAALTTAGLFAGIAVPASAAPEMTIGHLEQSASASYRAPADRGVVMN
jgi:hypothetical protein